MSWVLCVTSASIWVPETHIVINGGYFSKDEKDRRRFCKDCPPEALTRPNPLRAIITCSFVRNYVSLAFEDELLHVTDSRSCHDVRIKDPDAWQLTGEWRTLKILRSYELQRFLRFSQSRGSSTDNPICKFISPVSITLGNDNYSGVLWTLSWLFWRR